MKSDKIKFLLCLLFFVVLAAIAFRCTWPADKVFVASDMNIGRLALKKWSLPEQLTGFYIGVPVVGESSHRYILFNILVALMPLMVAANAIWALILVAGSASMVWFLRIWGRSWAASIFGALTALWFSATMLAVGGHGYQMEVLSLAALSLCLLEKAIRAPTVEAGAGWSMLAGVVIGITMLEQQDVALLAGLFTGGYTVFRLLQRHRKSASRWVTVLAPVGLVAVLLSSGLVLWSYHRNIAGSAQVQAGGEEKWNFITQWSMVPGEWPDLIASGWSGWGSGDPAGPYWGRIGQSAEWETSGQGFRNFKITSVYFGIVPLLLALFGMAAAVRDRKSDEGAQILFWCVAAFFGLWLAFGKYSILYKLAHQLPLLGSIRAPMKFLDNFKMCLGIVAAYGLDRLLAEGKDGKWVKGLWITAAAFAGMMLMAGLRLMGFSGAQSAQFARMGFEAYADIMVRNMSTAWFHAALLALVCAVLVFLVWRGFKHTRWVATAFVLLVAADSLVLNARYFKATDISALRKGNGVTDYLRENQGDERTFLLDQSGIYNQWLASEGSFYRINFFNIWQIARMPVVYQEFLPVVGKNQVRLWELAAVKFVAAPATVYQQLSGEPSLAGQFEPVLNYQIPTAQGPREDVLLEFKGAIPRLALFQGWNVLPLEEHCETLADPRHRARSTLLVTPDANLEAREGEAQFVPLDGRITKKDARVEVVAETPSILRFSQRYQEGWRAFVDGQEAPVLRVDYLLMGVEVPPGKHEVRFTCPSSMNQALFALGVFLFSTIAAVGLITWGKREP